MTSLHLVVTKLRAPGMGLLLGLASLPGLVVANPQGGEVVSGSATIQQHDQRLDIRQSSQTAIIDWRGFSIDQGEITRFHQPSASALAVNRVISSEPSRLYGSLEANGRIMLINQNGIHVGPTGVIDVAGLVATTHNLSNERILAGDFIFDAPHDLSAGILNQGLISVREEGLVALVSPQVSNSGVIVARKGRISIGAGEQPVIDLYGDGLIQFAVGDAGVAPEGSNDDAEGVPLIANSGTLKADGGVVQITARAAGELLDRAINMDGVVQARSTALEQGEIRLDGGEQGEVAIHGRWDVSASEGVGGSIAIEGKRIHVSGELSAAGVAGGGSVTIGDAPIYLEGESPKPPNTNRLLITERASIDASATGLDGEGGRVVLWSEQQTRMLGAIDVRPGRESGAGGFIELSSLGDIRFSGADLSTSRHGRNGEVLLDPKDISIVAAGGLVPLTDWSYTETSSGEILIDDITAILSSGSAVTLQAHNDITLFSDLIVNNGAGDGGALSLQAGRSILLNGDLVTDNGDLTLLANDGAADDALRDPGAAQVVMGSGRTIDTGTGSVWIEIGDGGGRTNAASSYLDLETINGGSITLLDKGPDQGGITLWAPITASGPGDAIVLATQGGISNYWGASVLDPGSGRFVAYSADPAANGLMGSFVAEPFYNATYASHLPTAIPGGNTFAYGLSATITVSPSNTTRQYGLANPVFTAGFAGYVDEATEKAAVESAILLETDAVASSNVGDYLITPSLSGSAPYNYNFIFNTATLGVYRAPLDISTLNVVKEYDGTTSALGTLTLLGGTQLYGTDSISGGTFLFDSPDAGAGKQVAVSNVTLADGNGGLNYEVVYTANSNSTIQPIPLHITANSDSRIYDATPYSGGAGVLYGGFIPSEDEGVLSGTLGYFGDSQGAVNAGSYNITPGGYTSNNYTISYHDGTLTIDPAEITLSTSDVVKTYDGTTSAAGVPVLLAGTLYDPMSGGSYAFLDKDAGADKTVTLTDVVIDDGNGGLNYAVTYVDNSSSAIEPAVLEITANSDARIYDGTAYSGGAGVVYSGFVPSEDERQLDGSLVYSGDAQGAINAGTYTITPGGYSSNNYTIVYNAGNLTIDPAEITLSTSDVVKVYDGTTSAEGTPQLVSGSLYDTLSGGQFAFLDPNAGSGKRVSVSDITVADGNGGGNYNITYVDNTNSTINKAPLQVSSEDATREYGTPNEEAVLNYSGFVNGEDGAVLDSPPTITTAAEQSSPQGEYAISIAGGSDDNYELIVSNEGTLTITPAALTVDVNDASREYGDANPELTFSLSGFRLGEDQQVLEVLPTLASEATPASDVGDYPITASGGSATNYSFSYNSGTLSVTPAPLLIRAVDQSRLMEAPNPPLTMDYSGFKLNDGPSVLDTPPQIATTAQEDSPVGSYPITVMGASDLNYTITHQDGVLTVNQQQVEPAPDPDSGGTPGMDQGSDQTPETDSDGSANTEQAIDLTPQADSGGSANMDQPIGGGTAADIGGGSDLISMDGMGADLASDGGGVLGSGSAGAGAADDGAGAGSQEASAGSSDDAGAGSTDETGAGSNEEADSESESMDGFGEGTLTDDTSAESGEGGEQGDGSSGDGESSQEEGSDEEGGEESGGSGAGSAEGKAASNEVSKSVQMAAQLKASGNLQGAANAYRSAVSRFAANADSIPLKDADGNSFFATTLDPAVRGLSEVLLIQAQQSDKPQEAEAKLREVRDAMDLLGKEALRDYFQDKGIQPLDDTEFKPEQLDPHTAMLYPVVLDERTSLVLVSAHGNRQLDVAVDRETLVDAVNQYRLRLQTREHNRFLYSAKQLYDWLIRPALGALEQWQTDTLVIVPDGKLRTIPFSALHNGEHFLVEDYALAVTPALKLYPPGPSQLQQKKVLTAGLSDAVQGFSALPGVPREINSVVGYTQGERLLNEAFVIPNLRQRMGKQSYGALHLATHAQFAGTPDGNFVLTYDDKLTLDRLQALLGQSGGQRQPLELISLSACQSALGDDKAALGLAGAAVKVGARAALGTLWFVDDEATSKAMINFYRELFSEQQPSKAKALQAVQKELIAQDRFWHPSYWAPFLLIGNWM